mmetsp:Transcript_64055/g.144485  ORF Transcript_64055/g.144485 Transcript_64055/m.144485 type:complete len:334 (+) Transcript_64055:1001-2002(+)
MIYKKNITPLKRFLKIWLLFSDHMSHTFFSVEMHAAVMSRVPLVFECCKAVIEDKDLSVSREGAFNMMMNFSYIASAESAECAVEEDRRREMAVIGDIDDLDMVLRGALGAGGAALRANFRGISACACGEMQALRRIPDEEVPRALVACAAMGLTSVVAELLATRAGAVGDLREQPEPLLEAAENGRVEVVDLLLRFGADKDLACRGGYLCHQGETPLYAACKSHDLSMVRRLIRAGANVNKPRTDGATPLACAAWEGEASASVEIVRELLAAGASQIVESEEWTSPVSLALGEIEKQKLKGKPDKKIIQQFEEIVRILREAGGEDDGNDPES